MGASTNGRMVTLVVVGDAGIEETCALAGSTEPGTDSLVGRDPGRGSVG